MRKDATLQDAASVSRAGQVIRDTATGERFKLVPLPEAGSEPAAESPEQKVDRLAVLERRMAQLEGDARDNATSIRDVVRRLEAIEKSRDLDS